MKHTYIYKTVKHITRTNIYWKLQSVTVFSQTDKLVFLQSKVVLESFHTCMLDGYGYSTLHKCSFQNEDTWQFVGFNSENGYMY